MTKITPTGFVPVEIPIISSALDRGRAALEFFQLNQKERVSIDVEDDHLIVELDECSLSWFLDTTDPEVRVRWWSGQADAYVVTGVPRYIEVVEPGMPVDEEDRLCDAVREMMGDLAAYGYAAQAAALNMLRPAPEPKILTEGPDGFLHCPKCDGVEFKENGSHPCDWSFNSQEAVTKTLVLDGSFEWYDGESSEFECEECGLDGISLILPDGWDTAYA